MEKKKALGLELIQALIGAALLISLFTVAAPCAPKADGGWMTCHWAGQAVRGLAALLLVFALIRLIIKNTGVRMGMDLASIPTALLAALLPGRLISLCMMADMPCRSVMRPTVLVFSVLLILLASFDLARNWKKK